MTGFSCREHTTRGTTTSLPSLREKLSDSTQQHGSQNISDPLVDSHRGVEEAQHEIEALRGKGAIQRSYLPRVSRAVP